MTPRSAPDSYGSCPCDSGKKWKFRCPVHAVLQAKSSPADIVLRLERMRSWGEAGNSTFEPVPYEEMRSLVSGAIPCAARFGQIPHHAWNSVAPMLEPGRLWKIGSSSDTEGNLSAHPVPMATAGGSRPGSGSKNSCSPSM